MRKMIVALLNLVWYNEFVPSYCRKGLIVSSFKKVNMEDSGNYRGITLLNLIGKLYSRIINNRLLRYLELNNKLHEGQGGFRIGRFCIF